MTLSLVLACLWVVVANLIAMRPSKSNHRPAAYVLIAVGVPILGYVTYENGPGIGLICLVGGASMLRWPIIRAVQWLRGRRDFDPAE